MLSIAARKLVRALPAILLVILCSRKRSFLEVNENGLRLMLTFHRYDQDEREEDGSRHWETAKSLLLRGFSQERALGSSDSARQQ